MQVFTRNVCRGLQIKMKKNNLQVQTNIQGLCFAALSGSHRSDESSSLTNISRERYYSPAGGCKCPHNASRENHISTIRPHGQSGFTLTVCTS